MKNDQWDKVKEIFLTLKNLSPELRLPYLDEACANDAETRRELESLLASHDEAEGFMETPAVGEVADVIYLTKNIGKGNRFGHYEIIKQIGAGGMGEVYLAEDKKLDRLVAVKILNERFAKHESNLQRFIREAKAASALNHPNILVIHEVGEDRNTNYIVSEFIKGKTLARILKEKPLKLADVLNISIQIASALCAAHEARLVHRDIKPENVMIRADGIVKVLDFGLAKLIEHNAVGFETSAVNQNQTAKGIILGTVNYMSPEQAKGEMIDARSDIFSFGIVLCEMLTGQHPFRGETINHTVVAILEKEPPPLALFLKEFPAEIERIIKKCLEKNLPARYGSANELLADLMALEKLLEFEAELERTSAPHKKTDTETENLKTEIIHQSHSFPPNNLKENTELIIGREQEISEIKNLLRLKNVRLLTLTGIGGGGKTRLAQAVAQDLLTDFPDGVFFVELASITNAELVSSAVAQPLGVKEAGGKPILETLKNYLGDKNMLLAIDNFEQVIDAAPQIRDLLEDSRLKILITSRSLLRLSAEREFVVPPLSVPSETRAIPVETLARYDAIKLFVRRGQKAKPAFVLTEENAASVAEICSRLDGLPLAIELAAARVRILSPQGILTRLDNSLQLLTGGARDLPARQQTMRGAIEWSYHLLTEDEKRSFRRLAVFAGGFTFEAAEAVCSSGDEQRKEQIDLLDLLTSLIEKSLLITKDQSNDGETRLRMLEVVREYALESLQESREEVTVRRRHAKYFLALAEEAEPQLQSAHVADWLNRLEEEHDNLRSALSWSLENEQETAVRLAGSLRLFWNFHGHLTEGRQWLEKVLDCKCDIPLDTRWKILHGLGLIAIPQGDYHAARRFLEQSKDAAILSGDRQRAALSANALALTLCELGDRAAAIALTEESLAIGRELNDKKVIAQTLFCLGDLTRSEGDYAAARRFLEESLEFFKQIDVSNGMCAGFMILGAVTFIEGDYKTSGFYFGESVKIGQKLGHKGLLSYCFDGFAALAVKHNDLKRAVLLAAAAAALRESIGFVIEKEERRFRDAYLTELRIKMDEVEFSQLYEQGRKLKPEESIALITDPEYQTNSISNF